MVLIPADTALWQLDLFLMVNLGAIAAIYMWGSRRVRVLATASRGQQGGRGSVAIIGPSGSGLGPGGRWPWPRTLAFVGGIGLLAFAYLGPFGAWSHIMFWPHMAQHLVVMMLAAPFIVLGQPIRLAFLNLDPTGQERLMSALRSPVMTFLTKPAVGWAFFATVLLGAHFSFVMNTAVQSHDFMEFALRPLFLISALIFYYPLLGDDLIGHRPKKSIAVISLGLMMIPETVLGIVIHLSPVVLYAPYQVSAEVFGFDALVDQKFAGALMWAIAMVLDGIWMMVAALEWWREQERLSPN
jgi:putative membrane protein